MKSIGTLSRLWVLASAVVLVSSTLVLVPSSGAGATAPSRSAWRLTLKVDPNKMSGTTTSPDGNRGYALSISGGSVDVHDYNKGNSDWEFHFDISQPPRELHPGDTFTIKITGKASGALMQYFVASGMGLATDIPCTDAGSDGYRVSVGNIRAIVRSDEHEYHCEVPARPPAQFQLVPFLGGKGPTMAWVYKLGGEVSLPVPTVPTIRTSKAYRAFYGLDDPITNDWSEVMTRRCWDMVGVAVKFSDRNAVASVPGEETTGPHAASISPIEGGDFYTLLSGDFTSGELRHAGNVFAKATQATEDALARKIDESGGELEPADVLKLALGITHGSYPLAVLTAHNFLKNVALAGREATQKATTHGGPKIEGRFLGELQNAARVVGKLQSLRADPAQTRDKIGPWYHVFAVLSAGAFAGPKAGEGVVMAEHTAKLLHFFRGEGGLNMEKFRIDECAALVAKSQIMRVLSAGRPR